VWCVGTECETCIGLTLAQMQMGRHGVRLNSPFASRNGTIQPMLGFMKKDIPLAQTRREDVLSLQHSLAKTLTA
jgi:hypothetical protein